MNKRILFFLGKNVVYYRFNRKTLQELATLTPGGGTQLVPGSRHAHTKLPAQQRGGQQWGGGPQRSSPPRLASGCGDTRH
jgi:hypothetical protein